jgi:hypothetical protein
VSIGDDSACFCFDGKAQVIDDESTSIPLTRHQKIRHLIQHIMTIGNRHSVSHQFSTHSASFAYKAKVLLLEVQPAYREYETVNFGVGQSIRLLDFGGEDALVAQRWGVACTYN